MSKKSGQEQSDTQEKPEKKLRKRQRADGRFQVLITVGKKADGKPIRKAFYGKTKGEAEQKAQEYKQLVKTGLKADKQNITLNEFVDVTNDAYKYDSGTLMNVRYLRLIREDLGNRILSQITEIDVVNAVKSHGPHSSGWFHGYCGIIKDIFEKAHKNRYIAQNPITDIDLSDLEDLINENGTHRALEESEQFFLEMHKNDRQQTRMAFFMMMTGLRIGEYEYLTWENIDLDNNVIHIRGTMSATDYNSTKMVEKDSTKTDAGMRDIPIPPQLKEMLLSIPEEYCKDRYWQHYGTRYKPKVLRNGFFSRSHRDHDINALNKYIITQTENWNAENPDLPLPSPFVPIRWHDLRHTYATMLYDADVDVKTAQKLLGHANLEMTLKLYQHLSKNKEKSSIQKLTDYFEKRKRAFQESK